VKTADFPGLITASKFEHTEFRINLGDDEILSVGRQGMKYMGEFVNDAGEAYAAMMLALHMKNHGAKVELSNGAKDTLIYMVESGPVEDGMEVCKKGRDALIALGLAIRIVMGGRDGYTAATYLGRDTYTALFPCADGSCADTIQQATSNRLAAVAAERV
jgi:hypothetical protein